MGIWAYIVRALVTDVRVPRLRIVSPYVFCHSLGLYRALGTPEYTQSFKRRMNKYTTEPMLDDKQGVLECFNKRFISLNAYLVQAMLNNVPFIQIKGKIF